MPRPVSRVSRSENLDVRRSLFFPLWIDYILGMLVKIWTDTFIITGEIDTMRDERLTDYVRENKEFIAVTQVNVADREGKDLFRTHFLNVSTSHIEIILPAE